MSLALNIVVASIALFNYLRAGHLSLRISIPLLISVPFAFIGGSTVLPEKILISIFVIALFSASAMLLLSGNQIKIRQEKIRKLNLSLPRLSLITLPLGAILGTVSGLVGIGGGIWLSPILILTGLAEIARHEVEGARPRRPARRRRLRDADPDRRQHQRADHHDRREGGRHDQGGDAAELDHFPSWPGLSRPSHSFLPLCCRDVDARHRGRASTIQCRPKLARRDKPA